MAAEAVQIREEDLQRWKLLSPFVKALQEALAECGGAGGTWEDSPLFRRQLQLSEYLSLFLFGLFNPVVKTMRGLCAVTAFERVQ